MSDVYNKKDVLDVLSNLYNNLPSEGYSILRKDVLHSANKIIKGTNPLPIINTLITELTDIIISNLNNNVPSIIETSNISLKKLIKKSNNAMWTNDYATLFGENFF